MFCFIKKSLSLIIFLLTIGPLSLRGQETDTDYSQAVNDTLNQDFGLFTNSEILHLALRFDLREYMRKKPKTEYLPAILTYYLSERDSINRKIRLKSRGVFRYGYCAFPPMYLNLKKSDFQNPDIKKISKMKLVTHCKSGNEDYLLKEYLAYKLYSALTDQSFRVRLVKIDYINTSSKSKTISAYGFFIEPLDILAERLEAVPVKSPALSQKNIIPRIMDRMAIFNYMIGNTDWSVPGQHNCKVLSVRTFDNTGLGVVIPYDFDYSGLVDANYAVPAEGLGISQVTQRFYQGECRNEETFRSELKEFTERKPEFYRIINEFPFLRDKQKKEMTRYLDDFFYSIEKGGIIQYFRNQCKY